MRRVMAILFMGMLICANIVGIFFTIPQNAKADTSVSGVISSDTTWTLANSPYWVEGNITLLSGVNLTIEAGVEVRFNGSFSITVLGRLNATGTSSLPINFTSNQTSPSKGDWLGIRLEGVNNTMDYCQIIAGTNPLYINGTNTQNSISNSVIMNCSSDGIVLNNTSYNSLINITVKNSNARGIRLLSSNNNTIQDSTIIQNADYGIFMNSSDWNSIDSTNVSHNDDDALYLESSNSNTISSNSFFSNNGTAINLTSSSWNNVIKVNTILSNNNTGLHITGSSNSNTLSRNNIINNSISGINITDSTDNLVHHNNFNSNGQNGYDSSYQLNSWDNGVEGNWWSDYPGSDSNGDGIGDTPHNVSGGGSKDFYPLVNPLNINAPIVESTDPANGAENVSVTPQISITFSNQMNRSSAENATSMSGGVTLTNFVWSNNNMTFTFEPSSTLGSETTYTVNVSKDAMDVLGVQMDVNHGFSFTTEDIVAPEISSTVPANGTTDVLITAEIVITFSEEMNTTTVTYTSSPDPGGWSVIWSAGNTVATYSHNDFDSETTYTFNITGGKDMAGNDLVAGSVPNPFTFTTEDAIAPQITSTTPSNGTTDVIITADVVIVFSEEMNTTTVTYTCTPDPGGWSVVWSAGNTTATYSHNDFDSETTYTFNITAAKDAAGNDLVAGSVPNPFTFTTEDAISPQISSTNPVNGSVDVLITTDIVITFSEEMNTTSVTYTCSPDPGGWSVVWSGGNTTATYSHSDFDSETTYTFNITGGKDLAGNDLVAGSVPNPFTFTTEDVVAPQITSTTPVNGTIDVPITTDIVIVFSEEMNSTSVTYTSSPDPGGWSVVWSAGNTTATYFHNDFASNTTYTFEITGAKDTAGNNLVAGSVPNPFTFTTHDVLDPEITSTSPVNGSSDVPVTTDIVIVFSEEMNTTSVTYTSSPDPGGWSIVWSGGNTTATYSHNDFASETIYTFNITGGKDLAGNELIAGSVPNPFTFSTQDIIEPEITSISPVNGSIDIPITANIVVVFSEEMDISTITYSSSPDPGGWSVVWSAGNTTATYSHNDFASETTYTFEITTAKDTAGNDLIAGSVPNPFTFTTEDAAGPQITTTTPVNGAVDVLITQDIVVTFNEEMNTSTVTFSITNDPGGWSATWSNGNMTVTYSHNDFSSETSYIFEITGGKDLAGNDLAGGAVPNPFSFTTEDVIGPEISSTFPINGSIDVLVSADIVITFNEQMNTSSVTYTCTPDPGGWSVVWSAGNTVATYSHNDFDSETTYTFEITAAEDDSGNALVAGAVPNPFTLTTEDVIEPEISSTSPSDGAINILISADIVITFSEEMNTTSVTYTCTPDPGGWSVVWSAGDTVATYSHNDFASTTTYAFEITAAQDPSGNNLVAGAVPNPFSFTTEDVVGPQISSTSPINGTIDVLINADIVINFNEEMDTSSVTYTSIPNPGGWSAIWSNGNQTVTYSHNDFGSEITYTFEITAAKDIAGNDLTSGAVPNPFAFTSEDVIEPEITSTTPTYGSVDVLINEDIVVVFSEEMDTSTVTFNSSPDPGGWIVVWSAGNTIATYSHNTFASTTTYTFEITAASDPAGNSLVGGAIPNPFSFTTEDVVGPEISTTSPSDGAIDVLINANIVVNFNEEMDTSSITFTSSPDPGGWSVLWSGGNTTVTYSHNDFASTTTYTFEITAAKDVAGNDLVAGPVPNPFSFTTEDVVGPQISSTSPLDGEVDVLISADIVIDFNEEMDTTSVTYTISPDPGGWSATWSNGNQTVTYSHNDFDSEITYTFEITAAKDVAGNDLTAGSVPNPISFTSEDVIAPEIIFTIPVNGTIDVLVTQNIIVNFSEEMDTSSVTFTSSPDPGGWTVVWSAGDTIATYSHNDFDSQTTYTFEITGASDPAGNNLIAGFVPNPWSFFTEDAKGPTILFTSPLNGGNNVGQTDNIEVTFGEAIDTSTLLFASSPNPGGWFVTWSAGDTVATFSHNPFDSYITYTFQILAADDLVGNSLDVGSVPNPWSFTTIDSVHPEITATSPIDGSIDIGPSQDVIVTFSEAMNPSSLTYSSFPNPGGWSVIWSSGDTVATFSHTDFDDSTGYTFTIANVMDLAGNSLVAGAVPNPFSFTTMDATSPEIIAESPTDGSLDIPINADIVITFNEKMDPFTVSFLSIPNPGGWSVSWNPQNTEATYTHNPFSELTAYSFEIVSGEDISGNPISPGALPNPFSFTTMDNTAPAVSATSPSDGSGNIALDHAVVITFSEEMNTGTLTYTCTPDPGGWSVFWTPGNTQVALTHNPFTSNTIYSFQVTACRDLKGNDLAPGPVQNPFSFVTIESISPAITLISPSDGAVDIILVEKITIAFSETMDVDSVTFTMSPDPGGWTVSWSAGNSVATFSHSEFEKSTLYTFQIISGSDLAGNPLIAGSVPNPFSFTTLANIPPSIISSPVLSATEEVQYNYDVEANDVDLDILTYVLTSFPSGMAIDSATGLITWIPTNSQVGPNDVVVLVTDGDGGSATQSFTISVSNVNDAPIISSTPVLTATEDVQYSYDVDADDADVGDILTFALSTAPTGMTIDPLTGLITWTPTNSQVGPNSVLVEVSDGNGGIDTQSFTLTVDNTNDAPSIISSPVTSATEDAPYVYDVEATDVDIGDVLTYGLSTFPSGMTIDPDTGVISWTPENSQVGDHPVSLYVSDSMGAMDTQSFTITVANSNDPPSIMTSPVLTATEDVQYSYDVDAIDIDDDVLTYGLGTFPTGMMIDSLTGLITWTPTNSQVGSHGVSVNVFDDNGTSDSQTFTIDVANVNDAPFIISLPVTTATEDEVYVYDVDADDVDLGDTLTFSLSDFPSGMTIDPDTGEIQWTPTNSQVGSNAVTVWVSDGNSGTDSQSFAIDVWNANDPPTITSTSIDTAAEDILYTYDVEASDIDAGDSLIFSLTTFPTGMKIDIASGLIDWTPTNDDVGSHNVVVLVEDGNGGSDTQSFTITVVNSNDAPTIISIPITTATDDILYTYDVDAEDVDLGDTLTYSLTMFPSGMTIDPVTGLIQWTPDDSHLGSNTVNVVVTDSAFVTDSQLFTINVANSNDDPTITSSAKTTATEDSPYSYDVDASDLDSDILQYGLSTFPAGMTIDTVSGLIQWTPTNSQVGSNSVVVVVIDGNGGQDTQTFTIDVANTNDAPTITSSAITMATEDMLYSYNVDADDVDLGDTLTYSLTTAPSGMSMDSVTGLISWTPTNSHVGAHNVEVLVSDSNGGTDFQIFSITVANTNDAPTFSSTPVLEATEDMTYNYDVDAEDVDLGDSITYSLTTYPTTMVIDSATGLITWIPTNSEVGGNPVTVLIKDGNGGQDTQSFTVTVANVNDPPVIQSIAILSATQDSEYTYDVDATDDDLGDTLTYSLSVHPDGMTIDSATGEITWTPANTQVGDNSVTVDVIDGKGEMDSQSFVISVTNVNDAPSFTSEPVTSALEESQYFYEVEATDIDGDTLTFSLVSSPVGMSINAIEGTITWTPTNEQVGSHPIIVKIVDGNGGEAEQDFSIIVENVNDHPVITSSPITQATEDLVYNYDVDAEDEDLTPDILFYELAESPSGMVINSSAGIISWTPSNSHVGPNKVIVVVTDGRGGMDTQEFTIVVSNVNDRPVINSKPVEEATEDELYTYDVNAFDVDVGDTLLYSLARAPAGMTIDSQSGIINWTPTNSDVGDNIIIVRVSDDHGANVTQTFTIDVENVNDPPEILEMSVVPETGSNKDVFLFSLTYRDIDGDRGTVKVIINGVAHEMLKVSGQEVTGAVYTIELRLSARNHTYFFEIDDDEGHVVVSSERTISVWAAPMEDDEFELPIPLWWIIIILIIIIISVAAYAAAVRRKFKRERKTTQFQQMVAQRPAPQGSAPVKQAAPKRPSPQPEWEEPEEEEEDEPLIAFR